MTIIYLLQAVVGSKRFEVTYSRDSLLIKKSSSSSLDAEFLLNLHSSSALTDGVSLWRSIPLVGPFVPATTFVGDFPNVYRGNCVTEIIDNNKAKFIIA